MLYVWHDTDNSDVEMRKEAFVLSERESKRERGVEREGDRIINLHSCPNIIYYSYGQLMCFHSGLEPLKMY